MTASEAVQLTDIIGRSGRYQTILYLMNFYSSWFMGTAVVTVELLAPMVTLYWDCGPQTPTNASFSSNDCKMEDIMALKRSWNFSNQDCKLVYESQYSRRTLTEELDMVCERSWLISLANSVSLVGLCSGNLLLRLSEKYGRRPFIIMASLICVVFSLAMSFTKGFPMFAACNFLYRFGTNQACVILFIQGVELTPPSRSPYISLVIKCGLLVAQAVFVGAAWILRDWFQLQLFQSALTAIYLLIIWYPLESPVWLAVRGKYEESRQVLVRIVQRNGRDLNEAEPKILSWLEQMKVRCEVETTAEKGTFKDLFKNKRITLYTCGLTYTSIATSVVYSSQVMNTESFSSDLYLALILSNVLSLVSVFVAGLLLKRASVRLMLCVSFLFEGLSCMAYPIAYGNSWASTLVSVLGRFFISPIFAINLIYVNDVYPTSVRAVGTGFSSFFGLLIASLSPFIKELGEVTTMYVPFILFGALSLTSALVLKMLPETKGRPPVHTVHELKGDVKNKKGMSASTSSTRLQQIFQNSPKISKDYTQETP